MKKIEVKELVLPEPKLDLKCELELFECEKILKKYIIKNGMSSLISLTQRLLDKTLYNDDIEIEWYYNDNNIPECLITECIKQNNIKKYRFIGSDLKKFFLF